MCVHDGLSWHICASPSYHTKVASCTTAVVTSNQTSLGEILCKATLLTLHAHAASCIQCSLPYKENCNQLASDELLAFTEFVMRWFFRVAALSTGVTLCVCVCVWGGGMPPPRRQRRAPCRSTLLDSVCTHAPLLLSTTEISTRNVMNQHLNTHIITNETHPNMSAQGVIYVGAV